MGREREHDRIAAIEDAIILLTELNNPKPKTWWDWIPFGKIRDIVYILGVPGLVLAACIEIDRSYLNREAIWLEERRNLAISRLDKLQDINSEIYQLQTQGSENRALAIIEAKRGQIARLTDTIFLTWVEQQDMLKHHDLNALSEALLIQGRTGDALRVSEKVEIKFLKPIAAIDQQILKARIQFADGPAQDIEAAREHLRKAVPYLEQIENKNTQLLMDEKVLQVRVLNEAWLNQPCETILPMAEALMEVRELNRLSGVDEDQYSSVEVMETVRAKCKIISVP